MKTEYRLYPLNKNSVRPQMKVKVIFKGGVFEGEVATVSKEIVRITTNDAVAVGDIPFWLDKVTVFQSVNQLSFMEFYKTLPIGTVFRFINSDDNGVCVKVSSSKVAVNEGAYSLPEIWNRLWADEFKILFQPDTVSS